MRWLILPLFVLCVAAAADGTWDTPVVAVRDRITSAAALVQQLNFSIGLTLYETTRLIISQPGFPVAKYEAGLSASALEASVAASLVARREREVVADWRDNDIAREVVGHIDSSNIYFAKERVGEVLQDLEALASNIAKLHSIDDKLRALASTYKAPPLLAASRKSIYLVAAILCSALLFWNRLFSWRRLAVLAPLTTLLLFLCFMWAWPPVAVDQGNDDLKEQLYQLSVFVPAYEKRLSLVRTDIHWIKSCLDAIEEFNETVTMQLVRFSERIADVSSAALGSAALAGPEAALTLLHQSKDKLHETRASMQALVQRYNANGAVERQMQTQQIIDELDAFERFFQRIEEDLYVTFQVGVSVNQLSAEYLRDMVQYIMQGKFAFCMHVLSTMEAEQRKQLTKLNASVMFISQASKAIKSVQREASVMNAPLSEDQRLAWMKKLVTQGALVIEGSVAAVSGVTLVSGAALAVPTLVACVALAAATYQFTSYYASQEREAHSALVLMSNLTLVTYSIDERLVRHQQVMSLLAEDINILTDNIRKAEERFRHVRVQPMFSEFEVKRLTDSTCRIERSVQELTVQYRKAMDSIFRRALPAA